MNENEFRNLLCKLLDAQVDVQQYDYDENLESELDNLFEQVVKAFNDKALEK